MESFELTDKQRRQLVSLLNQTDMSLEFAFERIGVEMPDGEFPDLVAKLYNSCALWFNPYLKRWEYDSYDWHSQYAIQALGWRTASSLEGGPQHVNQLQFMDREKIIPENKEIFRVIAEDERAFYWVQLEHLMTDIVDGHVQGKLLAMAYKPRGNRKFEIDPASGIKCDRVFDKWIIGTSYNWVRIVAAGMEYNAALKAVHGAWERLMDNLNNGIDS